LTPFSGLKKNYIHAEAEVIRVRFFWHVSELQAMWPMGRMKMGDRLRP